MKKSEKMSLYMSKGLTQEQAENLIKYNNDDYLTLDELRIKYNYPELGTKYPDWITPEAHIKMCFKTAKDEYTEERFGRLTTIADLANQLYVWSYIRLNKFNSHAHLKSGLVRICKNFTRQHVKRAKYWGASLDTPVIVNEDCIGTIMNIIPNTDEELYEELEVVNCIKQIKLKQIRELLIITAYLLADITSLHKDYQKIINSLDVKTRNNILNIEQTIENNEKIKYMRQNGIKTKTLKYYKVSIKDIINAFGIDHFGDYRSYKKVFQDIKDYLNTSGFVGLSNI